ncbi:hypothetical protein [Acidovorax kalamii]|uniref:hypothetical protein n=1 Tax=Acidovorax kalamii TaxID=2004485 RepID=UPI002090ADB5|nr:hypothetical protein [Acidovorax kalamii]MCO5355063.1 hypothetical protein [Acidovorax kalamii]
MTFYTEMAQVADEILHEFGAAGTLTYKTRSGEYDTELGDYPEVPVTQACTAVVFPVEEKLVDGTTVLATDEQAYLSAVGLSIPEPTHVLTLGGVARTVVSVKNLAPAGTSVLVELIVRR